MTDHPARCPFLIQLPTPPGARRNLYQCKHRAGHTQPHDSVVLTHGERQLYAEMLRVGAEKGDAWSATAS